MLQRIRKSRLVKVFAVYMALSFLVDFVRPLKIFALTSGPSQPEVQSFEPVGTTEMVDLFSGDFTYNIPLFELPGPDGGYPFNIAYHSGITMDQEASWVGLGWNLNPGAITRDVRNIPDEFDGTEKIKVEKDFRSNWTAGGGVAAGYEIFGGDVSASEAAQQDGIGSINLGINIYYNNYRGVGYSLKSGYASNFDSPINGGLDISMDSQEGVGVSPSLNFQVKVKETSDCFLTFASVGVSTGYNSRNGLTGLSLSSALTRKEWVSSTRHGRTFRTTGSMGGTANLSFSAMSFSPHSETPYSGKNIYINFKPGLTFFGNHVTLNFNGFFNVQKIGNYAKEVPVYGYMQLQNNTGLGISDFSREKEGMVHKTTKNLAIPNLTYDIYSVTGQGVGNMYRPYRSDYGIIYDKKVESVVTGASVGVEIGAGSGARGGANLVYTNAKSVTSNWDSELIDAVFASKAAFHPKTPGSTYEPYYFKTYGEHTADDLATQLDPAVYNENPVRAKIIKNNAKISIDKNLIYGSHETEFSKNVRTERKPRGVSMQPVTIKDILNPDNSTIRIPEFNIAGVSRTASYIHPNHIAGYTTINNSGARYVYALPAYNTFQKEYVFSVAAPGGNNFPKTVDIVPSGNKVKHKDLGQSSDEYYNETEMPGYPYAYLLTAVLGADYVDIDGTPGPSDGDLGYWVKFNYVKSTDSYKWKAPYRGANFLRGLSTSSEDDKGAFMYGIKEIWYLSSAETKTHIAFFEATDRSDGRAAPSWDYNIGSISGSATQKKLDKIELYSKKEYFNADGTIHVGHIPIKTVNFDYTYDLCKHIHNTEVTDGGKLTLKKLWFTYKDINQGSLSPYKFDYHEDNDAENPVYNPIDVDRWGNYKHDDGSNGNIENPYVKQDDADADIHSAVWNLKEITLPSGGIMAINYEADRYAYVQDQVAMQMFPIDGLWHTNGDIDEFIDHEKNADSDRRRVYFTLKHPISDLDDLNKYIDGISELYFKVRINLARNNSSLYEYVGGYAPVTGIYFDENSKDGNNLYHSAYIKLDNISVGGNKTKYHPFSVAAWQHIRTNQSDLIHNYRKNIPDLEAISKSQKATIAKSIVTSVFSDVGMIFKGFYNYMHNVKQFAQQIDLSHSYIRLRTPDKEKFGGGCRVKSLVLHDNWNSSNADEPGSIYGTVYQYTKEENGEEISSGVASYEPLIGGDEIALRKPVWDVEKIPLKTNNLLYSEEPFNENLYPGASVGYSEVTTMSLATYLASGFTDPNLSGYTDFANLKSTTGKTITEFYTAREYPVRSTSTVLSSNNLSMQKYPLFIPIPLVGAKVTHKLTASQGYCIILNDMHGKLKKVANYSQGDDLAFSETPISYVEYFYNDDEGKQHNDGTKNLVNHLPVLLSDNDPADDPNVDDRAEIKYMDIGVDYDFFTDLHQSTAHSDAYGGAVNFETFTWLPGAFPWPSMSWDKRELHTVVTNKVIHKSGVLVKVVAKDEQSLITTENKYFDPLTGEALLTTVNNNFDEPVYNYNMPAYWAYDGMGASYKNIGFEFEGNYITPYDAARNYYQCTLTGDASQLSPGDEFVVDGIAGKITLIKKLATANTFVIHSANSISGTKQFKVIRSGRRNQLGTIAGNITALNNPTENRTNTTINYDKLEIKFNKCLNFDAITNQNLKTQIIEHFTALIKNHITPDGLFFGSAIDDNSYSNDQILVENNLSIRGDQIAGTSHYFYDIKINLAEDELLRSYYNPYNSPDIWLEIGTCKLTFGGDYLKRQLHVYIRNASCQNVMHYLGNNFINYKCDDVTFDGNNVIFTINNIQYNCPFSFPIQGINAQNNNQSSATFFASNILSTTITKFSDIWSRSSYGFTSAADNNNPYQSGERGIWLASEPCVYVADRTATPTPDLKNDGVFNHMPIFDWKNPDFITNNPAWITTNNIRKINKASFVTESRNMLGVYSSSLYGYNGRINITNAQNARQNEIGFESFEEYNGNILPHNMSLGNIDIYTSGFSQYTTYDSYDILYAKGNVIVIDRPYTGVDEVIDVKITAHAYATSGLAEDDASGTFRAVVQDATDATDVNNDFQGQSILILEPGNPGLVENDTRYWTGLVELPRIVSGSGGDPVGGTVSNSNSHTGKKSFKINGNPEYNQNRLILEQGETYILSAWVKLDVANSVPTYKGLSNSVSIKTRNAANQNLITYGDNNSFTGNIIDGWQKVEFEFIADAKLSLKFSGTNMYVDDIRIFPTDAVIETYVYDNVDYKPKAVLDNNNYATFYYYNEEGDHYLTKRETERGIFTVKESRSFQSTLSSSMP